MVLDVSKISAFAPEIQAQLGSEYERWLDYMAGQLQGAEYYASLDLDDDQYCSYSKEDMKSLVNLLEQDFHNIIKRDLGIDSTVLMTESTLEGHVALKQLTAQKG